MIKIFNAIELSFEQYTNSLKNYFSKTFSDFSQKYNNSTVFGQLVSAMASTVQNILLYIEDAAIEQNKFSAVRKKSIYNLAQLTGYTPSMGKAAGVQLKMSWIPSNTGSYNIILPNHTRILCSNGMYYNIVLPQEAITLSLERDNSSKFLYAVEGSFESQQFVSTGGETYLQMVEVMDDIDDDYISVQINGVTWERAYSLYDMDPDAQQWYYKPSIAGGMVIGFGNNEHGRALVNGDVITVSYLRHSGERGNINTAEDVTFVFDSSLQSISGDFVDMRDVVRLSLANKDAVTSGTFSETSDQVKQMIGYNSRAMVLASPENYRAYLNRFSFVGYNRTWSEPGSLIVRSLVMKNYNGSIVDGREYFALSPKDFILTDMQKESIISNIKGSGRQLAGVTYDILNPELCKYALFIFVKLLKGYDQSTVETNIRSIVGSFFSNIAQDDYIPKSDIIRAITTGVAGIDGINCYFLSEKNETAIIKGEYTNRTTLYNPSTNKYDEYVETVHLYPGEDPGLGLDEHGDIVLSNYDQYPVLMGGWKYKHTVNHTDQFVDVDALTITFE